MIRLYAFMILIMIFSCKPNKVFLEKDIDQLDVDSYLDKINETDDYYIIDVRTPLEYKKSHLDGAMNISYIGVNFARKAKELDTTRTVFIYCETAHRSPYAAKKLKKLGFKNIIDLKGGYRSYKLSQK